MASSPEVESRKRVRYPWRYSRGPMLPEWSCFYGPGMNTLSVTLLGNIYFHAGRMPRKALWQEAGLIADALLAGKSPDDIRALLTAKGIPHHDDF